MPVISNGRAIADIWRRLADDEALPEAGPVIVSLKRFRSERETLSARVSPLGVALTSAELAHEIGEDAALFDLIEVELPAFRDGRAFSTARLLRERYRFRGTIRASGHILPDQALFLARCGVNEIVAANDTRVAAFEAALHEYSVTLQPTRSGIGTAPHLRLRPPAFAYAQAAE